MQGIRRPSRSERDDLLVEPPAPLPRPMDIDFGWAGGAPSQREPPATGLGNGLAILSAMEPVCLPCIIAEMAATSIDETDIWPRNTLSEHLGALLNRDGRRHA